MRGNDLIAFRCWSGVLAAAWMLCAPVPMTARMTARTAEPAKPPLAVALDAAGDAGAAMPRLHSLLVSRGGELILERYYHGARPARLANIKSAAKSVISALVGIAIERGLIPGIKQPITAFFPDLWPDLVAGNGDSPKRAITVEDLLTMRSGLETTSNRNYGAWVKSPNWVRYALSRPLVSAPGTTMEYSTGSSHLLSAILTQVTGASTWQFAQEAVARPLGFTLAQWPRDPQGVYFGGNEMLLTPRQMLAFGELYLNRGRANGGGRANGRQIVPAQWVEASLVPRVQSRRESERYYGYGWWIRELAGYQTSYAWGYGGQFIFLVPDLDLVIVTTSSTAVGDDRRGHTRAVYDLVERFVIPPIASATPNTAAARGQQ